MKARTLIALVVALAILLATAALWTTDSSRASSVHPDPERVDAGASSVVEIDPVPPSPELPDRTVAAIPRPTTIAPVLGTSRRIDSVGTIEAPGDLSSSFDRPQHRIFGSIRARRGGAPIASAQITCSDRITTTASADATGSYALITGGARSFTLTCHAPGWKGSSCTVDADGPTETRVDFALDPAADLIVRLQDRAGRPLFEGLTDTELESARALRPVFVDRCLARGSRLSGGVLSMRAASLGDAHGDAWYRASLDIDASGCCCLVLGDRVVDAAPFTGTTSEIVLVASREDIRASTGSLRLTIVDVETGAPIPGLRVRVTPSAGAPRRVEPDFRGGVLVEGLPGGEARVEFAMDEEGDADGPRNRLRTMVNDKPLWSGTVAIRAGELTDMGRKSVDHIVSISGWVDAAPDGDTSPDVFATHENESGQVFVAVTRPDSRGNFTFGGLKSGYYRVGCHMLPDTQTTLVDARFTDVQGVHIAASGGDLGGIDRRRR